MEFCLITSIRKKHWGFPKGIVDPGETIRETALKEAHEEAGLSGEIIGEPIGSYRYAKWETSLNVVAVLMRVTDCTDRWEEDDVRERRWASPSEARQMVARDELRDLIDSAVKFLNGLKQLPRTE